MLVTSGDRAPLEHSLGLLKHIKYFAMILESHDTVPPQILSHPPLYQHYFENYGMTKKQGSGKICLLRQGSVILLRLFSIYFTIIAEVKKSVCYTKDFVM